MEKTLKKAEKLGAKCAECPLKNSIIVLGDIPPHPKMIIVGEGPGHTEEVEGKPFIGESGQLIARVGKAVGFERSDLAITNACLCWIPEALPKDQVAKAIHCCKPRLINELRGITSPVILALGGKALLALTGKEGIFNWQGGPLKALDFPGKTVIPALHPAHVLRYDGRQWMPVFMQFVQRAWLLAVKKLRPFKWPHYVIEPGQDMVDALLEIESSGLPVGNDTETFGEDPLRAPITCLSIATKNLGVSIPWHGYFTKKSGHVPPLESYKHGAKIEKLARRILENPRIKKTYHNAWYDILALRYDKNPIHVQGYDFDTLLAHQIVSPPLRHGLDTVAAIYLHAERWKNVYRGLKEGTSEKGAVKFHSVDPIEFRVYNCKDSMATILLRYELSRAIKDIHRGEEQFVALMKRTAIAAKMQERGVPVDLSTFRGHISKLKRLRTIPRANLRKLYFRLQVKHGGLEKRALAYMAKGKKFAPQTGIPLYIYAASHLNLSLFNPRSQKNVKQLFGNFLGAPILKRSAKTGQASYNDTVLQSLIGYQDAMTSYAAGQIVRYRTWDKLVGFLESKNINGVPIIDGIAHTNWKSYGTRTGRWSSPLMIIPKSHKFLIGNRKVKTPGLRDIFVGFNNNWVVEADFKMLEAIILALMAGDERWIECNNTGGDVHSDTARIIWRLPKTEEPSKDRRQVAKTINYALLKGASIETLWQNLQGPAPGIGIAEVERIFRDVMKEHRAIKQHLEKRMAAAIKNDYIESPLSGLRFYFYGDIKATEVKATPEQMFAADLINRAIIPISDALDWPTEGILFQVHDALVVDGPNKNKLIELLKTHMPQKVTIGKFTTTFNIDIKVGKCWGDAMEEVK